MSNQIRLTTDEARILPHSIAVRFADIAYDSFTTASRRINEIDDARILDYYDVGRSQAYLFKWRHIHVLTARGTEASKGDVSDILSNLNVMARRWIGPGKAHRGYAKQFERILPAIAELADTVEVEYPLVLDGHSMGGAIVTQAASYFPTIGWKIAGLVTFGAPKSLDMEACLAIEREHRVPMWRFTNRFDFAPSWPPSFSLSHPTPEIRLNSGGWPGPVSRHKPSNYIKAIDKHGSS